MFKEANLMLGVVAREEIFVLEWFAKFIGWSGFSIVDVKLACKGAGLAVKWS